MFVRRIGVEVVPDTAFENGPANTIRDVLGWVPAS
jgi:iron complex outermembrane receptor protein